MRHMKKEVRTAVYDKKLKVEAYRFEGMVRSFPPHFHEHYVIGCVESGRRTLSLRNREVFIGPGDLVVFHPGENHGCTQSGGDAFGFCGFSVSKAAMAELSQAAGQRGLPVFSQNVISDGSMAGRFQEIHEAVMRGDSQEKGEAFFTFLSALMERNGGRPKTEGLTCRGEIGLACGFMAAHFAEHISLEDICRYAGLSKSALCRAFLKEKGITPYRYLENVRVNEARRLLEQGTAPLEAAVRTGFSDQSHFTNYFSRFTGLAPGVYRDMFREKKKEEKQDGK